MKTKEKTWPTYDDLLCWYIFDMTERGNAITGPDIIKKWLEDYKITTSISLHRYFYNEYTDFREQFMNWDET